MWNVVIALLPALVFAVHYWGWRSLWLTLIGVVTAIAAEALIQFLRKVPVTVTDGSAVLTGMLLTYNISAGSPWWLPVMGSLFAIIVGKQVFGGLGKNPVNPALLGRAFLLASWPSLMTGSCWVRTLPRGLSEASINGISNLRLIHPHLQSLAPKAYDLVTGSTPLKVAQTLRDTSFVNTLTTDPALNSSISTNIFNSLVDMGTLSARSPSLPSSSARSTYSGGTSSAGGSRSFTSAPSLPSPPSSAGSAEWAARCSCPSSTSSPAD